MGSIITEAFRTIQQSGIKDQIVHVTRHIYTFYAANTAFSQTLIKESLLLGGPHGKIHDAQLNTFLQSIAELISSAVKRGELAPETDVFNVTAAYGAFYFSVLVMALKKPEFDVEEEVKRVGTMLGNYLSYADGKG